MINTRQNGMMKRKKGMENIQKKKRKRNITNID